MSDWSWVTDVGARGEMVVEICPHNTAKFAMDFVTDVRIGSFDLPEEMRLIPGDICIIRAEVTSVKEAPSPTVISVRIFGVEFVQKSDQRPDGMISEMMKHLDDAKALESTTVSGCPYCSRVDSSTPLIIKRDLHACAKCGRILTTREYDNT